MKKTVALSGIVLVVLAGVLRDAMSASAWSATNKVAGAWQVTNSTVPATSDADGSTGSEALDPRALARARAIQRELSARYSRLPGAKLVVTQASSTGVVESFTLLSADLLEARTVAADNGIWYAVCPVGATCPYPARRHARPAASLLSRRLALELALRTFRESSADFVAVGLPTTRFTVFALERSEVARDPGLQRLASALERDPTGAAASWTREEVDRITRPRVFVFLAMEPTPSGRDSFAAVPRWPDLGVDA
jgi:hypothetical protein